MRWHSASAAVVAAIQNVALSFSEVITELLLFDDEVHIATLSEPGSSTVYLKGR